MCGEDAGRWENHWNRDRGYGICPRCAAEERVLLNEGAMEHAYGSPGVNYAGPRQHYPNLRRLCLNGQPVAELAPIVWAHWFRRVDPLFESEHERAGLTDLNYFTPRAPQGADRGSDKAGFCYTVHRNVALREWVPGGES